MELLKEFQNIDTAYNDFLIAAEIFLEKQYNKCRKEPENIGSFKLNKTEIRHKKG